MIGERTADEALRHRTWAQYIPDFRLGFQNLLLHKLRTMLTMLGMIFGVAAVVAMLSIGAGAQQQVMAFIEQLGVRNLIVEAKEATAWDELQRVRRTSPGLTFRDHRVIRANVAGIVSSTPRKRFTPQRMVPKPQREVPVIYGVEPAYQNIAGLRVVAGRFFDQIESDRAAPVCVLGEAARASLFPQEDPLGKTVKANDQWFRVIGVVAPMVSLQTDISGVPAQDRNNVIYIPLYAAFFRLEDNRSEMRDEVDGIYLQLEPAADSLQTAEVVRGLLNASHRNTGDFSVIVPAELLAEQRRTQRIFDMVMVAIASISLLVGGIGIMNIMLASILERTREIGVRRAVGARQRDIVRQFLIEAILISFCGGIMGIGFGFAMSGLIAQLAGWTTIVTSASVALAFLVSVSVGLVFGIYPATKAARLDPVEAIRYE
ncbi:MAG: ABC transporter permease [Acidobacteria bacterium]|nr:ABC transporter permease [Acidobacteriota bacterium]MCL5287577.1 ABC transporter permease [Acidobacteriota bacterium]